MDAVYSKKKKSFKSMIEWQVQIYSFFYIIGYLWSQNFMLSSSNFVFFGLWLLLLQHVSTGENSTGSVLYIISYICDWLALLTFLNSEFSRKEAQRSRQCSFRYINNLEWLWIRSTSNYGGLSSLLQKSRSNKDFSSPSCYLRYMQQTLKISCVACYIYLEFKQILYGVK